MIFEKIRKALFVAYHWFRRAYHWFRRLGSSFKAKAAWQHYFWLPSGKADIPHKDELNGKMPEAGRYTKYQKLEQALKDRKSCDIIESLVDSHVMQNVFRDLLSIALSSGATPDVIEVLLKANPAIIDEKPKGETVLVWLLKSNTLYIDRYLYNCKYKCDVLYEIVQLLIRYDVNVNWQNWTSEEGYTALHYAVQYAVQYAVYHDSDIPYRFVQLLLDAGANTRFKIGSSRSTILIWMIEQSNQAKHDFVHNGSPSGTKKYKALLEIIECLIQHLIKENPNNFTLTDTYGNTALDLAIRFDIGKAVFMLSEAIEFVIENGNKTDEEKRVAKENLTERLEQSDARRALKETGMIFWTFQKTMEKLPIDIDQNGKPVYEHGLATRVGEYVYYEPGDDGVNPDLVVQLPNPSSFTL